MLENIAAGFHPIVFVSVYSLIILFVINIFYRVLVDQNKAKETKERVNELSKKMKESQKSGSKEDANKAMSQMMQEQGRLMRMSMKPMIVSLIIVIIFLPVLAGLYPGKTVARLPLPLPVVNSAVGWLGWYIIFSVPGAILTRKLMKINI
ncbi:MAG: EMC3/TMCO1 family protein [Candidatus Aenigmarchaeota archaeon]|nr:EMC3/TMCO1 family protein [Candidatus Aenigmarchaeota archaeon]MDI6722541.1 EMC3/TMCO1 family protein [Candidatus Aenigmarchaeota archaeon]